MIQVCSRCGTRWNVRDRQRGWCPRCHGALLAPTPEPAGPPGGAALTGPPPTAPSGAPDSPAARIRQARPAGFRWIAVRPGPPPPPRRRRRPLGPTPRYQTIPRWGLTDRTGPAQTEHATRHADRSASASAVRVTIQVAAAVLAVAALAHALRYLLLLINRTTLLHPLVANGSLLMGILVSLGAIAAVGATAAAATSWLIARRAEVYRRHGQPDPRPEWALWVGCLVPVVNLVWAPVFIIELAHAEGSYQRLRGPITVFWIGWIFTTLICGWAIWTSGATEPQAVADNTETMLVAYLSGAAVLILLLRVFDGFVSRPMQQHRPAHRWVVVAAAPGDTDFEADVAEDIESRDSEPAA